MRYLSLKAIALGTALMLTLNMLFSLILFLVYASTNLATGPSQAALISAKAALSQDNLYLMAGLVLGSIASIFGGFVTARISKSLPYFNCLTVAVLGLLAQAIFDDGSAGSPVWDFIIQCLIIAPGVLTGAVLAAKLKVP